MYQCCFVLTLWPGGCEHGRQGWQGRSPACCIRKSLHLQSPCLRMELLAGLTRMALARTRHERRGSFSQSTIDTIRASCVCDHWLLHRAQAYAVGFFAIPLVRWLRNKGRNARIEAENADRRQASLEPVAVSVLSAVTV